MPRNDPHDTAYQREAQREADRKMIEVATPALRSILAFCIYLRFGNFSTTYDEPEAVEKSYEVADLFIDKLKGDYQS